MNIKKLLALLLAVVMLLSLAACADTDDDDDSGKSSSSSSGDKNEEDTVVGEWEGELDFGVMMNELMAAEDEDMAAYFDFDGLTITMCFDFDKSGKLSIEADRDSLEDMVDDIVDIMLDGYEKLFEDQGMSWEDTGMTKDDMRDMIMEEFDADALEEMTSDIASEGYYVVVDDRIYTAEDEDDLEDPEEDAEEYMEFKLKGDTLTIKDIVSGDESIDDYVPGLMPIELERK